MNKKIVIFIGVIIILLLAGYSIFNSRKTSVNQGSDVVNILKQPERQAEINGYIITAEGNELTIANEIGLKELSDAEKAERQNMTQEERQALKAQETANLSKENINLTIPVGTVIVKGSGNSNGENVLADISELSKGIYVSIWKDKDVIEFVKLKGVSGQ